MFTINRANLSLKPHVWAQWIQFPEVGHNVRAFSPCARRSVADFIAQPESGLDVRCALHPLPLQFMKVHGSNDAIGDCRERRCHFPRALFGSPVRCRVVSFEKGIGGGFTSPPQESAFEVHNLQK